MLRTCVGYPSACLRLSPSCLNPLHAGPLFSNRPAVQRTDFLGEVCAHRSERILFSFHSTLADFIILGLLERSGPSEYIMVALSDIDTQEPLPPPLQTTPPCLETAQQLNFTFLVGILPKFNRFSQFKLPGEAEIPGLHLMPIKHATCHT